MGHLLRLDGAKQGPSGAIVGPRAMRTTLERSDWVSSAMALRLPRTRLEQKMLAAQLTQREMLRRFTAEARRSGEGDLPLSPRQLKRWLSGSAPPPRPASVRVLESWWGEPIERLFGPAEEAAAASTDRGGDLVAEAGRQSVEHALDSASALDPSALEHLHAAARNAARAYLRTPPLELLTDLVELRDTIYTQLDRTNKPLQQAELYLLAGQACGLLSSISFDLGHPSVADEQARAAHTYGSVIDHPSLRAWARALQVTVLFWSGQPRRAAGVAEAALLTEGHGTARVRLHSTRARALALIGARDEVDRELAAAADELELAGDDDFLDGIGGELNFGRARQALCASSAYIALADGARAEVAATRALEVFASQDDEDRWGLGIVSAAVDLATALALRGDLAGTEAALDQVFRLPPAERTESVSQRLLGLGHILALPRNRKAVEAIRLGEGIEMFTASSLARTTVRPAIGAS